MSCINLNEKLRLHRKEKQLLQRDVATQMGVSRALVALWETGKRKPDAESTARLARLLGVSTDYLIGLSDKPGPILFDGSSLREDSDVFGSVAKRVFADTEHHDGSTMSGAGPYALRSPLRASASVGFENPFMKIPGLVGRKPDQGHCVQEASLPADTASPDAASRSLRLEVESMLKNLDAPDLLVVRDVLRAVFRDKLNAADGHVGGAKDKDPGTR